MLANDPRGLDKGFMIGGSLWKVFEVGLLIDEELRGLDKGSIISGLLWRVPEVKLEVELLANKELRGLGFIIGNSLWRVFEVERLFRIKVPKACFPSRDSI